MKNTILEKKRKILIVFDDIIADMINNKKLNTVVTEIFIWGKKLNISFAFITKSYFKVPKDVILNSTYFFIMKIPNKTELQQIVLNHSSYIDFKEFIKIYKKCTAELCSFLVNDTTLPSDNPLRFSKNLLKQIYNKIMRIDDQIIDEKLQYDINREAAKISALSSGKINKYQYLTGEEILPYSQKHITEQAKFTYFSPAKAFKKQKNKNKNNWRSRKKQVDVLKDLKLEGQTKSIEGIFPKDHESIKWTP